MYLIKLSNGEYLNDDYGDNAVFDTAKQASKLLFKLAQSTKEPIEIVKVKKVTKEILEQKGLSNFIVRYNNNGCIVYLHSGQSVKDIENAEIFDKTNSAMLCIAKYISRCKTVGECIKAISELEIVPVIQRFDYEEIEE